MPALLPSIRHPHRSSRYPHVDVEDDGHLPSSTSSQPRRGEDVRAAPGNETIVLSRWFSGGTNVDAARTRACACHSAICRNVGSRCTCPRYLESLDPLICDHLPATQVDSEKPCNPLEFSTPNALSHSSSVF